ncbi:MAG: alpha-D-ribose 1-methylphosphonate 5-triphosphate diphosphatase [Aminipila sp.]
MKAIKNGRIIGTDSIIEDKIIIIDGDTIVDLVSEIDEKTFERVVNAHGRYIMPGFIDIHSDKIEQFIQPRPTSVMDFELAMKECERQLLFQGITTMYHSLSLYKDEIFGSAPVRKRENVEKLAALISDIHNRYHLIHHRFHLRIEIDNLAAFDIVKDMIEKNMVHEISFMDHTPGQGQYRNLEIYKKTIEGYKSEDMKKFGFDGIMENHKNKNMLSFEQLKELTELAHAKGIAVASHDDDTADKLRVNEKLGVDISEFPITIATAKKAKELGFYTVAGAPNILLGGSHSGNMSAAQAILEDCVDVLCSDYYPSALLHSIFMMNKKHNIPLWDMVAKVTLNAAKAVKIEKDYGSVQVGKKADLLIVDILDGYPSITHSIVDGVIASRVEYRR